MDLQGRIILINAHHAPHGLVRNSQLKDKKLTCTYGDGCTVDSREVEGRVEGWHAKFGGAGVSLGPEMDSCG